MNFVKREEYEEMRAMYIKSRNEIELLKKNIKNIEKTNKKIKTTR